jgi:cytochrome P450
MVGTTAAEHPSACPYRPAADDRKSVAPGADPRARPVLAIRSFDLARQILRGGGLRQAGFKAELLERFAGRAHAPVLFQEGEAHQKQRSATARFFAPKVVTTRYRTLMTGLSDRLVTRLCQTGHADLDAMSLELAVAVAAEIVGLTDSARPGMADRLNRFFAVGAKRGEGALGQLLGFLRSQIGLARFHFADVRPAIRARRRQRCEDVISHLIDQGYTDREILTECLTYGAAGMATTREFIVMAAWHLLERPDLRARYLDGDEAARLALLEEVLRLEPVVGMLYRRAERDLTLDDHGRLSTVPAGTLIAIDVRAANTDPAAAGACPLRLDPDRVRGAANMPASLLSFGDGPHRCPGASVALQETAIFLDRLLQVPGIRLARAPALTWNPLVASYELRGAVVTLAAGGDA